MITAQNTGKCKKFNGPGLRCCCCIDYSVLMYKDEIQLKDVKEYFWYELHALTSTRYSTILEVRPKFPLELIHYYLSLARVWQVPTLIWNLTVRRRGRSNHHIFVMLLVDSNHLPPELEASALTTHPLNRFTCRGLQKTENKYLKGCL